MCKRGNELRNGIYHGGHGKIMCNLCECEDSNKYMDRPMARKLLFLLTAKS